MIIICLGNYEKKYENTRHNYGRNFGKFLCKCKSQNVNLKITSQISKFGEIVELNNGDKMVFLNCFMNESGETLNKLRATSYELKKVKLSEFVIIHDDLDLPFGEFKIQLGRGAAGHHGVESVINALGTKDFWRIRLGIGNPEKEKNIPAENFVLMNFDSDEEKTMPLIFNKVLAELSKVAM